MASHMSCIGLPIRTKDDFMSYLKKSYNFGMKIKTKNGTYLKWEIGDGVELWGQLDIKNTAIGMNPHFNGSAIMKVLLTNKVTREEDTKLDGSFHGWANPQRAEDDLGDFPFVFDLPNMDMLESLRVPQIVSVQIAAFPHEIQVFESEEAYYNSQIKVPKLASRSFIPSGLFSLQGDNTIPPRSEAIITGFIEDFKRITNNNTGYEFYWTKISTLGGEIDVVIDPNMVLGELKIGGIVSGSFWLSGKIVSEYEQEKKSFFEKVFGK